MRPVSTLFASVALLSVAAFAQSGGTTPPPLSITTVSPLFNGTVGVAYSQSFSATGGTLPYVWTLGAGSVLGLTLSPTGTLSGTPLVAGTVTLTIRVTDNTGTTVPGNFSITINPATLTISTPSALPAGTASTPYSQTFTAVGGKAPYTWSVTGGALPGGLNLDPAQGIVSGTPASAGSFSFTLQATDANAVTGSRTFTLSINSAPLKLTTANQLPDAKLGAPYSFQMTASGGVPPYSWSANGLPSGLTLDGASGLISGTVGTAGTVGFTVTLRDGALTVVSDRYTINVTPPALPAVTISGLPASADPLGQYTVQIKLASAYPVDVTGTALLTSVPNDKYSSDQTIKFSSGGRSTTFTIAGGSTSTSLAVQAGTVSGTITLTLSGMKVGGLDVTPSPAPSAATAIAASAPVITKATVSRSGSTLTIQIQGYATSREVTTGTFVFGAATGQTLQTSQFSVPLDTLFSTWYSDAGNAQYGSQFVYSQPFTISGDINSVIPQTVTLTNRAGTNSAPVTQ